MRTLSVPGCTMIFISKLELTAKYALLNKDSFASFNDKSFGSIDKGKHTYSFALVPFSHSIS